VPPSRRSDSSAAVAGGRLDTLVAEIHGDGLDEDVSRVDTTVNRRHVRDHVREVAVEMLVDTRDCSPEAAAEMLETGSWTERPRARVFLGRDVPRLPLSVQLRDWASGEGFRRRASATIEEIATQAGVDHGESIAPTPVGVEETERDTVQWPPEPAADDGDRDELDRLLERPPEEFRETSQSGPDPEPEPQPGEAESGPGAEVFRREVIPGDAATDDAAGSASTDGGSFEWTDVGGADDREVEREWTGGEGE